WWTLSVGCLGVTLLHQMTGGNWGYAARPFLDAGVRTLPLVAVAFLPLAFGLDHLYEWTEPDFFAGDPHAHNRAWYLQSGFFLGRAGVGFAICLALGWIMTIGVVRPDGRMALRRLPKTGGFGCVLLANVVTLAAVDWTMSLEPHYTSTMYGALFIGAGLLGALCISVVGVAVALQATARQDDAARKSLHDLGTLTFALLMVWAYLSFSQFLITYSGNLPHAAEWYVRRLNGGWQWLGIAQMVLKFAVPFLLLLSRSLKRSPAAMAWVALGVLGMQVVEMYWVVVPAFYPDHFHLHWLDAVAFAAIGGLWLAEFSRQLQHRLVPVLPYWPYPEADYGRP
ncbi:MAG: hypothetical protein AB7O38_29425, partial [Pirellulaceae bacterium]